MSTQSLEDFAAHLIAETLFYDEEYGALGNLSLIDPVRGRELYVASYVPKTRTFAIEEASEWESSEDLGDDDAIGYALAIDSVDYGSYASAAEAAAALLDLAREKRLLPSVTLLFEEEGEV